MTQRTNSRAWLVLLFVFAMFATACGGEVTEEADDDVITGSDDETTETDDGEGGTDDDGATSDDGGDDDASDGDADAGDDASGDDAAAGPNIYDDPRGGVFADFQATYDRGDHPFTQVDQWCVAHDAAADRVETEPGIGADEISIVHIKSRLEDAVDIGFGIPVGDMNEMFRVFVDYVNAECGGIRGRQVNLETIEVSLFGPTTQEERNAACLEATEDFDAVAIVNSSGFQGSATLCIVEEKETIFVSTQGQSQEFMDRSNGRLFSLSNTNSENIRFAAVDLLASGTLAPGDVVGVASPDTDGQPEDVEENLVNVLRDAGLEVVYDIIGCGGSTICSEGISESVANMRDAEITHFFNVMGILTAPGYIDEMVNQGFQPGDVQFIATDFNSQAGELVSSQIPNSPASGELYDGAIIIDFRDTGEYRAADYQPTPYQEMCVGLYNENNTVGATHAWNDEGDSAYGMAVSVCSILRATFRGIYDAGDNPTRADIESAMNNLGPVDLSGMIPASIEPGKGQMPNVIQTMDFAFPCDLPIPFVRSNGDPSCVTGRGDYRPAPR
ncbi:MAG: hypothetical protein AAGE98_11710 [Actinomycetota bacterium]